MKAIIVTKLSSMFLQRTINEIGPRFLFPEEERILLPMDSVKMFRQRHVCPTPKDAEAQHDGRDHNTVIITEVEFSSGPVIAYASPFLVKESLEQIQHLLMDDMTCPSAK